jgi:predicted secreted acid phosphatase
VKLINALGGSLIGPTATNRSSDLAEWIVFPNAGYGTWSKAPLKAWEAETVIEAW